MVNKGVDIGFEKEEELYLSGFMIAKDTDGARFDGRSEYDISPYTKTLLSIIE
jgi:hypothetical protein